MNFPIFPWFSHENSWCSWFFPPKSTQNPWFSPFSHGFSQQNPGLLGPNTSPHLFASAPRPGPWPGPPQWPPRRQGPRSRRAGQPGHEKRRTIWDGWTIKHIYLYGYGSIPIKSIFRGMNIHLPTILMFTRGTRFWHTAIIVMEISLIINYRTISY